MRMLGLPLAALLIVALALPVVALAQEQYCTLGQGFYGNTGGSFNGFGTTALLDSLLSEGALTVGKTGCSLTFPEGASSCIIGLLPAGARPVAFPDTLGDAAVDSLCGTPPELPLKKGRFRNVLIGQTVSLTLNTRLDDELSDLEICPELRTVAALPGDDGLFGTGDDVMDTESDTLTFTIPESVIAALVDSLGLPQTVGGVLELANRGLAGEPTGGARLGDVNQAASAINDAFDGCRFLVSCTEFMPDIPLLRFDGSMDLPDVEIAGRSESPKGFALSPAAPNPARESVSVSFAIPEPSHVRLSVYNVLGQVVAVLADEDVYEREKTLTLDLRGENSVSSGVYFVRMDATGIESGRRVGLSSKMLVVR
jgi:hypothetical protein